MTPNPPGEREPEYPNEVPLIAMHGGMILFPFVPPTPPFMPPYLAFQGQRAMAAVEAAMMTENRVVGLIQLRDAPRSGDIHVEDMRNVGTLIYLAKYSRQGEGALIVAQGRARIRVLEIIQQQPYLMARVEYLKDTFAEGIELEALKRAVLGQFRRMAQLSPRLAEEVADVAEQIDNIGYLADFIAAIAEFKLEEKQEILEAVSVHVRLEKLMNLLAREVNVLEIGAKIQSQAQEELSKDQKEYVLRQQMKQIQKELGDTDDRTVESEELKQRIEAAGMPEEVKKVAEKELDRLAKMSPAAAEYTVARTYLDTLVSLPWSKSTEDNLNIQDAAKILDEDHYGLEKVKDRILEYLSVRKLKADMKGPILCFVGPPGVGKTSLGRSIARALGRKFARMSLGGVHDEAEIRGHRRTYIGALPGRILQNIRSVESNNPVIMLDEIDKLGADWRGDPSSAMLEVLDPEQNHTFTDHYLEVPFDLSKVMFIATANVLDTVPPPLRDRMEVISLPGYTNEEKIAIARKYLLPKQMDGHGITAEHMTMDAAALERVIKDYTREAGVRNLEREIGTIIRKVARKVAEGATEPVSVNADTVPSYLGAQKFYSEIAERTEVPGVVTGLAYTPTGGEILFIEATKMPGKGNLTLTGQLGDVMRESAQAAMSYIRSNAEVLRIPPELFERNDFHIHVPAGATPKDGPSAGIAMTTALASLATGRKVKPNLAMTGEVTLRGKVMPIGGIKEKTLGAKRAGIETIVLPARNESDLLDAPDYVREGIRFVYVGDMVEVFDAALEPLPVGQHDAPMEHGLRV